jgi:hypothetical protein
MGSDYCFNPVPVTTRTVRQSWIVGCILSGVGYGALLVVGHACLVGLRQRNTQGERYPRVKKVLILYVVFTLILTTVTEIIEIAVTVNSALDDVCFFQSLQPPNPYLGRFPILIWLIDITTDSLFVRIRMTTQVDLLTVIVAGLEVLYCLWRSTGTKRLVYFIMGHAIDRLPCNAL